MSGARAVLAGSPAERSATPHSAAARARRQLSAGYVLVQEQKECDDDGETRFRNPDYACASACVALYAPVCGENGITYANECLALCSNVRSIDGACYEGRW